MKKFTAAILIICYSLALIRPLVPIIGDVLAHTFWRAQHMATVHFENGKYHVHYALQEIAKSDQSSKRSSSVKADESLDIHVLVYNEIPAYIIQPTASFQLRNSSPPVSASLNKDAPPPEV